MSETGGPGEAGRGGGAPGEGRQGSIRPEGGEPAGLERVARLRDRIMACDRELIAVLRRRLDLVREIGDLKSRLGVPVTDPGREAAVVRRAAELARAEGLDEELVRSLIWSIMSAARSEQYAPTGDRQTPDR